MKRHRFYLGLSLIFVLALTGIHGQTDSRQKLDRIKQILQSMEIEKTDPAISGHLDGQLEKLLNESKKLLEITNAPSILSSWKWIGFQNEHWTAQTPCGQVQYQSAHSVVKPGHWLGEKVKGTQFRDFCRSKGMNPSEFKDVSLGAGPIVNLSEKGRRLFVEWIIERPLLPEEERFILPKTRVGEHFVLVLPEIRKNAFYYAELGRLPLEDIPFGSWDQESSAITEATAYWKKSAEVGASPEEKEKIDAWLLLLQKRQEGLTQEKGLYEGIENLRKEKLSAPDTLDKDLEHLGQALERCERYRTLRQQGNISAHFEKTVQEWARQWQFDKEKLQQLKSEVEKIEEAHTKIREKGATLKPEELQPLLEEMLSLLNSYRQTIEKKGVQAYSNPKIMGWQKETEEHLHRLILVGAVDEIRNAYKAWKDQENISNIQTELDVLKSFKKVYEDQRKHIKENNPYHKNVQDWVMETEKRFHALVDEKETFAALSKLYPEIERTKDLDEKILKLNQGISLGDDYQARLQKAKASSYHQRAILEWHKTLQDKKRLLGKEVEIYTQIKSSHERYTQSTHPDLSSEVKSINDLLSLAEEYEKKIQYKEISSYHQQECKKWAERLSSRKVLLGEEENAYARIQAQLKKWEGTAGWNSGKDEVMAIQKVLEQCKEYDEKLARKEISGYFDKTVKECNLRLEAQKKRIDQEEELYEPIQKLQALHAKTKYSDLASEKNALARLIERCVLYLNRSGQKEIATYYRKFVQGWHEKGVEQKKRLDEEEALHAEIVRSYAAWEKRKWDDAKSELDHLTNLVALCTTYKNKTLVFEISNYHNKTVFGYLDKLEARKKFIEGEESLFLGIKKQREKIHGESYTNLSDQQKDIQSFLGLYADYQKKVAEGQMASYHQKQIEEWGEGIRQRERQLQEIMEIHTRIKNSYNTWDLTTYWPELSVEEESIDKVLSLVEEYKNALKKHAMPSYDMAGIEKYLEKLTAQKERMKAEQSLYDPIREDNRKYEKEKLSSLEEEKERLKSLNSSCDEYLQKTGKGNEYTKHYQKSVRSLQRKFKDRQKKLEKEESLFKQTYNSYRDWKSGSPWPSKKDERDSIDRVLQNTQMYKEFSQMQKITEYNLETVKKYEEEMQKRIAELNK